MINTLGIDTIMVLAGNNDPRGDLVEIRDTLDSVAKDVIPTFNLRIIKEN